MAKSNKSTIIWAIVIVAILVFVLAQLRPMGSTASVTGAEGCTPIKFVDMNGNTHASFFELRQSIPDLKSLSDTQLSAYGLSERADGVYVCQ